LSPGYLFREGSEELSAIPFLGIVEFPYRFEPGNKDLVIPGEVTPPATVFSDAIELVVKNGSIEELAVVLVELNFSSIPLLLYLWLITGTGFDSIKPYF